MGICWWPDSGINHFLWTMCRKYYSMQLRHVNIVAKVPSCTCVVEPNILLQYCMVIDISFKPKSSIYLQKRGVGMSNADFYAHTAPRFNSLKVLSIFKINSLSIACFMYSYHNQCLPPLFHNQFLTNQQVHSYNTRDFANYRTHLRRATLGNLLYFFRAQKFVILFHAI